MKRRLITTVSLVAISAIPSLAFASWKIDQVHTTASFAVAHMMFTKTRGEFTGVSGTIDFNEKEPTLSKVDVAIDTTTIDTRHPKRDEHLKGPDFLDVVAFPRMFFKSNKITRAGPGYQVFGELTIRGVSKPVILTAMVSRPMKNPWGTSVIGIRATTKINRKDFGMTWNKTLDGGGLVVGDEVEIELEVELTKGDGKTP